MTPVSTSAAPTSSTGIISVTSIIFGNPCQIPANIFVPGIVVVNLLRPGRGPSIRPDDRLSSVSLLLSSSPLTSALIANEHDDEDDDEEHKYDNKEAKYSCRLSHDISCSSMFYIHT